MSAPPRYNTTEPFRELGPVFVQLHSGPPGADCMENVVPIGRAPATKAKAYWDSYGVRSVDVACRWENVTVPLAVGHTVWNSPTGGRCIAVGRFNEPIGGVKDSSITLDSFLSEECRRED